MPPGRFIAAVVKLAMVGAAQGNGELVSDLPRHRSGLGEADMMGIGRGRAAQEAWLRGDEAQVLLVADPSRFGEGKGPLVDGLARL